MKKKKGLFMMLCLSIMVLGCMIFSAYKMGYISWDKQPAKETVSKEIAGENGDKSESYDDSAKGDKNEKTDSKEKTIRVLINNSEYTSLYHKSIRLTCSKKFCVTTDGKKKIYPAGKVLSYKASDTTLKGRRISIKGIGGARIKVLSVKRQYGCPLYRGNINIVYKRQGLLLKNTLTVEQYLYAVVPSELSTGSRMEALKAQAVCARSYAYAGLSSDRYKEYGGDVEDSVSCQVYNNISEDARARKAVDSTKGRVMSYNGELIGSYYFSTSWGYTAEGRDVWGTDSDIPYLRGRLQITEASQKDTGYTKFNLSEDENFRSFIDKDLCETYDGNDEWYRWHVNISGAKLGNRVYQALLSVASTDESAVLTQNSDGTYRVKELRSLGKIKSVRVEKRQKSGLVTEIVIVGNKNVVKVCGQYNIRKVLAPVYEKIYRKNSSYVDGYSLLPSAAFYIDIAQRGRTINIRITGGGFGHGSGMSQVGAAAMAKSGSSYVEILKHYFSGIRVQDISALEG